MVNITKHQIAEISLSVLSKIYHFHGKPDFDVDVYLQVMYEMEFKDVQELRRVHNAIVTAYKHMPKPVEIKEILEQNRKEKEDEAIAGQQEKMLKDVTQNGGTDWQRVQKMLLKKHGENIYKSWFSLLQFQQHRASEAIISTPTRFIREYIITHYERDILAGWQLVNPSVKKVRFTVRPDAQRQTRQEYNNKASAIYGGRYG